MCDICGGYFCYPSCPSYDGNSAELGRRLFWCSSCACAIHEGDSYFIDGGRVYCDECLEKRGETVE